MPAPAPSAAKTHHPDVNASHPDASERFKRITAAYTSALLHSSKRAEAGAGLEACAATAAPTANPTDSPTDAPTYTPTVTPTATPTDRFFPPS